MVENDKIYLPYTLPDFDWLGGVINVLLNGVAVLRRFILVASAILTVRTM